MVSKKWQFKTQVFYFTSRKVTYWSQNKKVVDKINLRLKFFTSPAERFKVLKEEIFILLSPHSNVRKNKIHNNKWRIL